MDKSHFGHDNLAVGCSVFFSFCAFASFILMIVVGFSLIPSFYTHSLSLSFPNTDFDKMESDRIRKLVRESENLNFDKKISETIQIGLGFRKPTPQSQESIPASSRAMRTSNCSCALQDLTGCWEWRCSHPKIGALTWFNMV